MKLFFSHLILCCFVLCSTLNASSPYFASGIKIGEVDQHSAIIWVRLTENKEADFDLLPIFTKGLKPKQKSKEDMPLNVVPGVQGEGMLEYWAKGKESQKNSTPWAAMTAKSDYSHQFKLTGLQPNTQYEFKINAKTDESGKENQITGNFKTAPTADQEVPVSFIVTTCQAIRSVTSGKEGHVAYQQMLNYKPDFLVHTGDILYYDKAPFCTTIAQARAKWNLMFAYGYNREFHRHVGCYFMKDDHDTLKDDTYPGQTYGDLTFADGLRLFREQVPMGEKTYRTVRWGKDVQVWMIENRDFRSNNKMPDGPNKTILGKEQKAWLKQTVVESDAKFKFLIFPGPVVGPDKKGKADNHSNKAFQHEGQELRDFIAEQKNTYVICGDRHWQYCSKDPKTGILEMGCGPIDTKHTFGGSSGEYPKIHRYFGERGGFLAVTVKDGKAKAEWYMADVLDSKGRPKVGHTEKLGK